MLWEHFAAPTDSASVILLQVVTAKALGAIVLVKPVSAGKTF